MSQEYDDETRVNAIENRLVIIGRTDGGWNARAVHNSPLEAESWHFNKSFRAAVDMALMDVTKFLNS